MNSTDRKQKEKELDAMSMPDLLWLRGIINIRINTAVWQQIESKPTSKGDKNVTL